MPKKKITNQIKEANCCENKYRKRLKLTTLTFDYNNE